MRIPPPLPRIDVDHAWREIQAGMTVSDYARRHGHGPHAVSRALRRAGLRVPKRRSQVRDRLDARLRSLWTSIRSRCENPDSDLYPRYGALGARVCREWQSFPAFRDWARAQGLKPGQAILLRVTSRGYRPSNCVLGSHGEATAAGAMASIGGVTAFGETKSVAAWARDPRAKVCGETIRMRLLGGIPAELAIANAPGTVVLGAPPRRRARRPRRSHPIDWARVQKLYVEQGLGVSEVAERLGVSYHGVLRGLQKRGWVRERRPAVHDLKHGRALHKAWCAMRERCRSPKHPEYRLVGAAGIEVDAAWDDFWAFHDWALRAGYRKGLCLTRLDRQGDYGPQNCAWLPRSEAAKIHRPRRVSRKPRFTIPAFGERKGPVAWARDPRCAVTVTGLLIRLKQGMHPEDAITTPSQRPDFQPDGRAVRAFGSTRSIQAWARDPRARVAGSSIRARLERGWTPEQAISTPPFREPK